jgi:putative ABC transport system ATP-binding protein
MSPYLRTTDLCRYYRRGPQTVHALESVSMEVHRGEYLALVGASGSGKTTMLNLLAGLDSATSGTVYLEEAPMSSMSRRQLSSYRATKVGMIFQSFNLIPHYTALQNVETALYFTGTPPRHRKARAQEVLELLGLGDRLTHRPADLSGGEQQRVAVARAIVKRPEILFADEPTGNLDYENTRGIAELIARLNAGGLTVVMVTHNQEMAREHAHRMVRMQYGRLLQGEPGERPEGGRP